MKSTVFILFFIFISNIYSIEIKNDVENYNFGLGIGGSTKKFGRGLFFNYSNYQYVLTLRNVVSIESIFNTKYPREKTSDFSILFGYKTFYDNLSITYSVGLGYFSSRKRTRMTTEIPFIPFIIHYQFYESETFDGASFPFEISILPQRRKFYSFGFYFYGNINQVNSTLGFLVTFNMGSK